MLKGPQKALRSFMLSQENSHKLIASDFGMVTNS